MFPDRKGLNTYEKVNFRWVKDLLNVKVLRESSEKPQWLEF
jgi:hypothetical protein